MNDELRYIVCDLETTEIKESIHTVDILGYGLASKENQRGFIWNDGNKQRLIDLAARDDVRWVFHNASFDVSVLRRHGVPIRPGTYEDTMILSWCWDATHEQYNLDECCRRLGLFGKFQKPGQWEVWDALMEEYCVQDCIATLGLWNKLRTLFEQDSRAWHMYETIEKPYIEAIMEFERTGFLLDEDLLNRLTAHLTRKREGLYAVLTRNVQPVPEKFVWDGEAYVPNTEKILHEYKTRSDLLTGEMQQQWVEETIPVDSEVPPNWEVIKVNAKSKRVRYLKWVYLAGQQGETVGQTSREGITYGSYCSLKEFNPGSPQQLAYLLQTKYGWQFRNKTKTGLPATDEEELSWIIEGKNDYSKEFKQFMRVYLDYTTVNKMLSDFLLKFIEMKDANGIIRGSFNQTGTKTGRLSSSNPNLQNIPAKFGVIRRIFIAPNGWMLVGIDLSNIEGRVFAHYLSIVLGDESMANIFKAGVDFHQANADAWGVTRNEAKTLLYAILYGAGAETVGRGNASEGKRLMAMLDKNAPSINLLKEMVWKSCADNGGVIHDFYGRRLVYQNIIWNKAIASAQDMIDNDPEHKLWSHDPAKIARMLQARAKRQVFNALLQGTAASVLKILTIEVMKLHAEGIPFAMAAAIHDEIQNYVPDEWYDILAKRLEEIFKADLLPNCPIKGDAKWGHNWHDTH